MTQQWETFEITCFESSRTTWRRFFTRLKMNPDRLVFKGMKCNKKSNNKIRAHWTGYRRSMIKIRKVDGLLTRLYKNGRPARPSYHVILRFGTLTRTLRMMHLRYQSWPCRLVGVIVGVTFSLQESSFFENCHSLTLNQAW